MKKNLFFSFLVLIAFSVSLSLGVAAADDKKDSMPGLHSESNLY
ncbi:hypothetical protein [Alkalihalobacillus pseudalcaliphilus]|nr:hypothetical protein [Alkalihalobacillus pseudalcaliphilus]